MPRLLVAEDSRLSRRIVANGLREAGYDVTEAADGALALELFRQSPPDCVVTDLLMPNMTGQELLEHVRATDSDMPVIIASADIQASSRSTCEALGITAFLNKPIDIEELVACVASALACKTGEATHDIQ